MSELIQYKYEKHAIETKVLLREDITIHDEEVEKFKDDGWQVIHTIIGYKNDQPMKKTVLERYIPLSRGLRTQIHPIDEVCDIKDEIKELIQRYKHNVSTTTVALYEEFIKDLEELIK